jgi:hypothetical protein
MRRAEGLWWLEPPLTLPDVVPTCRPRALSLRGQKHLLHQHLHPHSPPPELGGRKGREKGAHRRVPRPPQAVWHLKQLPNRVVIASLSVGSTAGLVYMTLHLRNIKELSSPRGQPTEQTKTQQTTKKGRTHYVTPYCSTRVSQSGIPSPPEPLSPLDWYAVCLSVIAERPQWRYEARLLLLPCPP